MYLRISFHLGFTLLFTAVLAANAGEVTRRDASGDPLPKGAIARLGTRRLRQPDRVCAVAISPNGKYLASCVGNMGPVRLWDRASGAEVRFKGEPFDVAGGNAVVFSPDSKRIASIVNRTRGTADLWGVCLRELPSGAERANTFEVADLNLCYSPDGTFLATGNALLNPADLSIKLRLKAKGYYPRTMALSPDGKLLATGEGSGRPGIHWGDTVRLWDTATGKLVAKLEGHRESVEALAFSPDGKTLASTSMDQTIRFWDVAKRRQVREIEDGRYWAHRIAYSPNGRILAAGYIHGPTPLRFWDSATGKHMRLLPDCRGHVNSLAFSPDGNVLVVGGIGHTIQLWDLKAGKQVFSYPGHQSAILCVRFSPDGKMLASRGADRTVRLWDRASGKEVGVFRGHDEKFLTTKNIQPPDGTLAWSPDGKTVAATDAVTYHWDNRTIYLWDSTSGKIKTELHEERYAPRGVAFAPDGETVATTNDWVQLWSLRSLAKQRLLRPPGRGLRCNVIFLPDGRTLAVEGRTVSILDWTTGRLLREFSAHPGIVKLACSRGGQVLLSCADYSNTTVKTIRLWETASGTLIRELGSLQSQLCVALSPDGRLAAFSEYDPRAAVPLARMVVLWDVVNAREVVRFKGHEGAIYSLDFSPDGNVLASGGMDTTILLWDVSPYRVKLPAMPADAKTLDQLWAKLEGREAAKPYQALWALAGAGDTAVAFLDRHLRPVPVPDNARLGQLLAGLEDNDFDARTVSTKELTRLGPVALPALRQALAARPKLDLRRRLQDLIEHIERRSITEPDLRQVRALHVLEQIGSPAARRLLGKLARGAPGAPLTRDALAAFNRLKRTTPP